MRDTITAAFDPHAYTIIIQRVVRDGQAVFHGRVAELPDLEAYESTYDEAYAFLVDAVQTAKAAFDEQSRPFPPPLPSDVSDYSGRVTIRMPKWLHARLDLAAQADGTSLNQYMVAILAAAPTEPLQSAIEPAPSQSQAIEVAVVGGNAAMRAHLAALWGEKIGAKVALVGEEQPEMAPAKGSVVQGIQNVTYHWNRPVFRTALGDPWNLHSERQVRFKRGSQTKKRK